MPKLICKAVTFYSENDELAFFEWVEKIKCIKKFEGVSDEIHLHIPNSKISDQGLRDLLALFHRYKISMKQLKQFENEKNEEWFKANQRAYWHKKVFKD